MSSGVISTLGSSNKAWPERVIRAADFVMSSLTSAIWRSIYALLPGFVRSVFTIGFRGHEGPPRIAIQKRLRCEISIPDSLAGRRRVGRWRAPHGA
ncbi:hypothetical protein [Paraburkholderia oxyphila]|uniref:hypothetical protein n=1 Tax=Paraburkholderia oxyphila TaxID=614212 RepID=UPI0014288A37|nr:hypothetical protein [Paraburkholderia oxyphila]